MTTTIIFDYLSWTRFWMPASLLACTLSGCGSSSSASPSSTGSQISNNSQPPAVVNSLVGTQIVLADAPLTDIPFERYDIAAGLSYSYGFSIGDYNGDGHLAISYFDSYGSGRARMRPTPGVGAIGHVVYNNGENDTIYPNETFPGLSSTNPAEFLLEREVPIDVNGDGRMDIAGVSNSHSAVVAYINPGVHNVTWGRRVLSSLTPGPVNLTVADVNGDGLPDIIVAMRFQPDSNPAGATVGVAWLENTGKATGEWIYHAIDTTAANWGDPRTVQAADINKDGKIDVVTSDAVTGVVAWYEQVTPTTWTRHVIPGVSTQNAHFGRVYDMNGDGLPDIVVPVTAGVAWLENVGNGASWTVHQVAHFTDPNWVNLVTETVPGDVHHDGTLDIVFSVGQLIGGYSTVRSGGVYIAHASGSTWTVQRVYKTENNVCCLDLMDFDSTGVLSIVSNAEYQQNGITIWQNQLGLP